MSATGRSPRWWQTACAHLRDAEPRLAPLIDAHPPLRLASRGDAFQTLTRSIVGQQISVKAAQSVWSRLISECTTVTPASLLARSPDALRACGLSGRKVEYCTDLARHFAARDGGEDAWAGLDDAAIIAELTAVRGIGVWTVHMFLIFHLGRPDVWPLGDLGLRRAIERQYSRGRPTAASTLARLSRQCAPWRTAATWHLWRSLESEPIQH